MKLLLISIQRILLVCNLLEKQQQFTMVSL
nr:MAG TPA: hypothetical protein [Crassvirales sp.]DAX58442.1 MAG TPA: hypothetical protein [Caudoviricetes sp.]